MQQVTIDGTAFEWLEQGRGEPVVLVHGAPFADLVQRFAAAQSASSIHAGA